MAKTAKPNPQLLRQIRQLSEEKLPDSKSEELSPQETNQNEPFKESLEQQQMKANDEAWAKKRREEIEAKIKELVEERKQQILKRREEPPKEIQEQKIAEEQKKKSLPEVVSKPKRGLFWGRRIKTAQQQAQPETAGRRSGG